MYCSLCETDSQVDWDGRVFLCGNCGATLSVTRPNWTIEELPPKTAPKEPEQERYICACGSRKVAENFLTAAGFHTKYWNLELAVAPQHGELPEGAVACDMNCIDCYTVLSREAEMLFINERDSL